MTAVMTTNKYNVFEKLCFENLKWNISYVHYISSIPRFYGSNYFEKEAKCERKQLNFAFIIFPYVKFERNKILYQSFVKWQLFYMKNFSGFMVFETRNLYFLMIL